MYLALDLGRKTGWARWAPSMSQPKWGTEVCDDKDLGHRCYDFRRWLHGKMEKLEVTDLVVEAYLSAASGKNRNFGNELWTPYQHLCCAEVCVSVGAKLHPVHMATWRKHFLGMGIAKNKGGRPYLKKLAIQRCAQLGWGTKSDDEAEALGLLDYYKAINNPRLAAATTDLFAQMEMNNDTRRTLE